MSSFCLTNTCVPDPCLFAPTQYQTACEELKLREINVNMLYSFSYMSYSQILRVTDGVIPAVTDNLSVWFLFSVILILLPLFLTMLVLLIYLIYTNVVSAGAGAAMIVFLFIICIIAALAVSFYTNDVYDKIVPTIENKVWDNYYANEESILCNLATALLNPESIVCPTGATGFTGNTGGTGATGFTGNTGVTGSNYEVDLLMQTNRGCTGQFANSNNNFRRANNNLRRTNNNLGNSNNNLGNSNNNLGNSNNKPCSSCPDKTNYSNIDFMQRRANKLNRYVANN
jgi:hypothetical protein